jgi:multidrug efflux pump subunit AcrB
MNKPKQGFIALFMKHKVAANLMMALMLLSGFIALNKMNIQFLPSFEIDVITVSVDWPGASAEDVEQGIIFPLERELRNLDNLKKINATARQSFGQVIMEFNEGTDMAKAMENVRDGVEKIDNFPRNSEKPIINRIEPYENIARILIYGPELLSELRPLAYKYERELLYKGIGKVEIVGLPEEEIAIQLSPQTLSHHQLSLPDVSQLIAKQSQDIPAGKVGSAQTAQNLRTLQKKRSLIELEKLPIITGQEGKFIRLGDISIIEKKLKQGDVRLFYQGKPAIELRLKRAESANALNQATIAKNWLSVTQNQLGNSLHLLMFEEKWTLIKQRIDTLIYNGLSGLCLIILILFIMLNRPIALWVTIGIPASVFASMLVLYIAGGSINMVSLFAFILTLGIIVDDTIVIGEQSLTNLEHNNTTSDSIIGACKKMSSAILSSSLTTISAFFPLLFVGGIIGTVLFDIPLVVICVIIASLIECFFILPGHLYHALKRKKGLKLTPFRQGVDARFNRFRDNHFRPFLKKCLNHSHLVITTTLSLLLICISIVFGGYIKFNFFPTPDSQLVIANVNFISGTAEDKRVDFLNYLDRTANNTISQLSTKYDLKKLLVTNFSMLNRVDINNFKYNIGEQYGSHFIELISSDKRPFDNLYFIRKWRQNIQLPTYVETLSITSPRGGPPGKDIDIQITGHNVVQIKKAVEYIKHKLYSFNGVSAIQDNLPFSQEQWIFELNAAGKALNLDTQSIGRQIRAAFQGEIVQTLNKPNEEVDVIVTLTKNAKDNLGTLHYLPIKTPNGDMVPLGNIVNFHHKNSPELILHSDTNLSANIQAEVDPKLNNANEILANLEKTLMPKVKSIFHIQYSFKGKAEEQQQTLHDINIGLIVALCLIYIILSWVFSSYALPLIVMSAIPLGLIGAIVGHIVMQIDLTLLSIFGLFGLSGIVINDSIILVNEYQHLKKQNYPVIVAIIQASCHRLRAVILTSVTTIAGLTPLLFERSLQAQFLIPMATSITFGLVFATFLILVVIPIMILYAENLKEQFRHWKSANNLLLWNNYFK